MVASILIIAVSAALLVYWFRYTCLLILRAQSVNDYATDLAAANQLSFAGAIRRGFRDLPAEDLGSVELALERDYRLLTYLLKHTASLDVGGTPLEQRMLMVDFMVMRWVAKIGRVVGYPGARSALEEMSLVLSHLANAMGERIHAARATSAG